MVSCWNTQFQLYCFLYSLPLQPGNDKQLAVKYPLLHNVAAITHYCGNDIHWFNGFSWFLEDKHLINVFKYTLIIEIPIKKNVPLTETALAKHVVTISDAYTYTHIRCYQQIPIDWLMIVHLNYVELNVFCRLFHTSLEIAHQKLNNIIFYQFCPLIHFEP